MRRRLGIPSLFRPIGVISLTKRSESDIVLSLHLSMSGRALTNPFNGGPLKILAASVQQWKCPIRSAYADVLAAHLLTRHAYSIDTNVYDDDLRSLPCECRRC